MFDPTKVFSDVRLWHFVYHHRG